MNGPAYDLYKQARNRIRVLEPQRVIGMAINALHKVTAEGLSAMAKFQPWNVLLLIKWVAQEVDLTAHRRRQPTNQDFNYLLNQLNEIENAVPMATDHGHWIFFLRKLSFQQFGLQHGADGAAVARQLSLFQALPTNHRLQGEFRNISGISIEDFCVFSTVLVFLVMQNPAARLVLPHELRNLEKESEPGAVDRFLRFLSKSLPELHDWLGGEEFKSQSIPDQRILPSPLLDAPLLTIAPEQFCFYYQPLLIRCLEQGVYRNLRRADSWAFGNDFGPLFEKYARKCLDSAEVKYLDEKALQKRLTGTGECVDFLVVEENCNVLIDAKAVEMSALGRLSHDSEQLSKAVSATVKAMGQAMATLLRIRGLSPDLPPAFGHDESFIVIVTYDDLYLGSPHYFGEVFADTIQQRLEKKYGNPLPIPFTNMFLLTIGDFEVLLELVREGKTNFVAALRHARAQDSVMETRKFQFGQHFASLAVPTERLPLVKEGIERGYELTQRRIKSWEARRLAQ
jgi:hypothetical protein